MPNLDELDVLKPDPRGFVKPENWVDTIPPLLLPGPRHSLFAGLQGGARRALIFDGPTTPSFTPLSPLNAIPVEEDLN